MASSAQHGRPARLILSGRGPASLDLPVVEVEGAPEPTQDGDPVLEDLARLEQLRLTVQANLMVRPVPGAIVPGPVYGGGGGHRGRTDSVSSISSIGSEASVYYTPIDSFSPNPLFSPRSATFSASPQPSPRDASALPDDDAEPEQEDGGMHPRELFHSQELSHRRPLLLDMRPLQTYLQLRIVDSINLSIPSLILKRVRKPTGAFKSLDALRPFITTDAARELWDVLLEPGSDRWDGSAVLFDDEMDERDRGQTPAWILLQVIAPLVPTATYLRGGFNLVQTLPDLDHHVEHGEPAVSIHQQLPTPPPLLAPPDSAGPAHPLAPRIAFTASTPLPPPSARSFALRTDVAQASNCSRTTIDYSLDSAQPGRTPSPLPIGTPPRTPRTPASLRIDIPPPPVSPGPTQLQRPPALQAPPRLQQPQPQLQPQPQMQPPPHPMLLALNQPVPHTAGLRPLPPPAPTLQPLQPPPPIGEPSRPRAPSLKGLSLDTSIIRGIHGGSSSAHPGAPRVSERLGSAHPMLPKLSLRTSTEQLSAVPFERRAASSMHAKGAGFPGAPPSLLGLGAPRVASELWGQSASGGGGLSLTRPKSPSHLKISHAMDVDDDEPPPASSIEAPPGTFDWAAASRMNNGDHDGSEGSSSSSFSSPPSPQPPTARPSSALSTPDSAEMPAQFIVSCILPNFLFLGPEITLESQVAELESLGVRRILNIAAECDDDHGLGLRKRFERYMHIPIRDTVEEENIARGVDEVCKYLDDARLHSSPTYVHCKAGKSRSVTAVMAYLIHANHWTLSKAYTFVLERRKGISPNIGFVSELMTFEERELGGKSQGVNGSGSGSSSHHGHGSHHNSGGVSAHPSTTSRRPAHIRESLPPQLFSQASDSSVPLYMQHAIGVGDPGEELEVKDASGRYRHQRRAPVNEKTLQPMRRVSKAGLESTDWRDGANIPDTNSDW